MGCHQSTQNIAVVLYIVICYGTCLAVVSVCWSVQATLNWVSCGVLPSRPIPGPYQSNIPAAHHVAAFRVMGLKGPCMAWDGPVMQLPPQLFGHVLKGLLMFIDRSVDACNGPEWKPLLHSPQGYSVLARNPVRDSDRCLGTCSMRYA